MSGIFGIVYLDNKLVSKSDLLPMKEAMKHRGTDGSSLLCKGNVGFGHLHRYYTPESHYEKLPLHDPQKNLTITADVRLENRSELLQILNIRDQQTLDSHLILQAYYKWQENSPMYLQGEFAFAIYDHNHQKLFCACDHLGYRPFYYYQNAQYFLFASEIKGVYSFPQFDLQVDKVFFENYMVNDIVERKKAPSETFFMGINSLVGARSLVLENKKSRMSVYWELHQQAKYLHLPQQEYPLLLRNLMTNAIAKKTRTDFPLAVSLSGGLDSTAIAAVVARQLATQNRELIAVSSVLEENEGAEYDERPYIECVAQHYPNIKVHYVTPPPLFTYLHRGFDCWGRNVHHFNDMHFALMDAAQKRGARGILNGELGDMTVSYDGRHVYSDLITTHQWGKVCKLFVQDKDKFRTRLRKILLPLAKSHPGTLRKKTSQGSCAVVSRKSILAAHFNMDSLVPFGDRELLEFIVSVPPENFLYDGQKRSLIKRAMHDIYPQKIRNRNDKHIFSPYFYTQVSQNKEMVKEMCMVFPQTHNIWKIINRNELLQRIDNIKPVYQRRYKDPLQIKTIHEVIKIQFCLWLQQKKILPL